MVPAASATPCLAASDTVAEDQEKCHCVFYDSASHTESLLACATAVQMQMSLCVMA